MDDPWGSPWASTDTPSDNDPLPLSNKANGFLSPPPRAFFGNATSVSTQSPWSVNNDDDGLGIWSTTDRADGTGTDNQSEWGAWLEKTPRLSPRLCVSGKDTPLTWPENAAASPVLMAKSRSRSPSIFRQHSPDPWATEHNLQPSTPANAPVSDLPEHETEPIQEAPQTIQTTEDFGTEESVNDKDGFAPKQTRGSSEPDLVVQEPPSRPSSTSSIDSHDAPERQDSPITSVDEERGFRFRNMLRRPSGKVQELVGIFDGLARAASEEPPTIEGRGSSQTRSFGEELAQREENLNDDEVGFGDYEDAPFSDGPVPRSCGETSSSELTSTTQAEMKHEFAQEAVSENGYASNEPPSVTSHEIVERLRGVLFTTNLALVDDLFPNLQDFVEGTPTEDWEAPDHIIRDSFTTISERKAWYRISRYGSMRKHNSGDDENYHRVTWPTSQLHNDTIKIVRRWMEQDSYAGKSTLGGTKRTGFFDWDSDVAPVELDKVFRRKKSTDYTRTASIPAPANETALQSASVHERPYRNSPGISLAAGLQLASHPSPPTASSKWNSRAEHVLLTKSVSPLRGQDADDLEHTGHPPPASVPESRPTPGQTTFADEDDDWGEMVSSPVIHETPIGAFAFPGAEKLTGNDGPTPRSSIAISDVAKTTETKLTGPQEMQPPKSSPWSSSSVLALDVPVHAPILPSAHISQPSGDSIFQSVISPPNTNSREILEQESTIPCELLSENTMSNRQKVEEIFSPSVTSKGTARVPNTPILPRNENRDDLIVQNILQNLPDLSYMLR